jgi:dipeptidyl-peptidase 4
VLLLPRGRGRVVDSRYLQDHAATRGFTLGRPVRATPTPDGSAVLFLRAQARVARLSLYELDVASGVTRELLTPEQLLAGAEEQLSPEEKAHRERMRVSFGGLTGFQLSDDGAILLVTLSGRLYTVRRADGSVRELATGRGTLLDPRLAPDGRRVAYVLDHDLYVFDLERGVETRLTTGGSEQLTHGLAEFVAQEEMRRFSGYWWSPDSQWIAYEEADASGVEIWRVADPAHPEQPVLDCYFPRPGKANAKVRLGVISARGGPTRWIEWGVERYPYLAAVGWRENAPLTLTVQTREQEELLLLAADPATGATTPLRVERDAAWVNLFPGMPNWLEDGSGFLWISERDGGPQLELRSRDGKLVRVLVPPDAGLQAVVDVDAPSGHVVYRASPDPAQAQLFRVSLDGGAAVPLTHETGLHAATFARDHSVYVHSYSGPDAMTRVVVRRGDGSLAGELPSVAEEPPFLPNVELAHVGPGPGFCAAVVRPRSFSPGKRYPVLVDVYGGPTVNVVVDAMGRWLMDQWLADQGFIVVSIDGRGTPGRGRDWERAIAGEFGTVPLADQVAGLEALGERFPELDLERVGIVGFSFGGYLAALAVLKRPDRFKAAVAGMPVADFRDSDTHYTERYLGLPEKNPRAYEESSLLTYAAHLERPLLLVHGTADDNVFFRHTLRLADALFRAGQEFELLPLFGTTHMVPDPVMREQLWSRIARFFQRHL